MMDELELDESKLANRLRQSAENSYFNCPPIQHLLSNREIVGRRRYQKCTLNQLNLISEKKLIEKDHTELACQLGPSPKSTFLMVFSPDGKIVASTHGDHNIYVTNVKTGICLHTLKGHPRTAWCIAFHPSSNDLIASGCLGGEVRIWDLKGNSEVWMSPKHNQIASLAFHPTDTVLAIATDNQIFFWNWTLEEPFTSISTKNENEKVKYVKFDTHGYKIITGIANIISEGTNATAALPLRPASCANPLWNDPLWQDPPIVENFHRVPNLMTADLRTSHLNTYNNPLMGRDPMWNDHNSDDSIRVEETRHSNRPSDESSSSSSSSVDSNSSMTSGVSHFNEWNSRLSLLWTSRRHQTGNESDNSAVSFDVEDNDDSQRGHFPNVLPSLQTRLQNELADNRDGNANGHGSYRNNDTSSANTSAVVTDSGPPTLSLYRNLARIPYNPNRPPLITGFHSPPPVARTAPIDDSNVSNSSSSVNPIPSTSRETPFEESSLDPIHGIRLLSNHIENMQLICGSLDLADISRLQQIRSMLIDIQSEIQSLRTAVDATNEVQLAPPIHYIRRPSVFQHHNYCTMPESTASSQEEPRLSRATPENEFNLRRELLMDELGNQRYRYRINETIRRIRQRRFEREDVRVRRDGASSNSPDIRPRIHPRSGAHSRYPEVPGMVNLPVTDNVSLFDRMEPSIDLTSNISNANIRSRTFSLNNETGPFDRSTPDQRPNRLLDWHSFARFRRNRNHRRPERSSTSLSQRISMMLQEQESSFGMSAADEEYFGLLPNVNISEAGPSNQRQNQQMEHLDRLRSFRQVMARFLQFVNELGAEVINSSAQANFDGDDGPPNDFDLDTLRLRDNYREAYRITLRSLISRIRNFIDTYLGEQTERVPPPLHHLEEDIAQIRQYITQPRSTSGNGYDAYAHNLRLLVRLALLLIYQIVHFISTNNILNEERPISRLPNPFRDVDGGVSATTPTTGIISHHPVRETLSDLSVDMGSLLEFVEVNADNLLLENNRQSSTSNLSSSVGEAAGTQPSRLTTVPRAQRLECRRLSRAQARARNLLNVRRSLSRDDRMTTRRRNTASQRRSVGESASDSLDVNSNYVSDAAASGQNNRPMDSHLRTFGGIPLRVLGRQNAFDRRSPEREEIEDEIGEEPSARSFMRFPRVRGPVLDGPNYRPGNRFNNVDQFMYYRQPSYTNSSNARNTTGFSSFIAPQRSNVINPVVNSIINIVNQVVTHRLQVWDFNITNLPDIADKKKNVIVRKCKIHFDASVEVSPDGTMLIALMPKSVEFCSVVICSLLKGNLGEILYSHNVEVNSVCVSLSPTMMHVLVGVGSVSNRMNILHNQKQVVAFVYKLNKDMKTLFLERRIELRSEHRLISLNCIKWLPYAGTGFIYGTNRGQLTILY